MKKGTKPILTFSLPPRCWMATNRRYGRQPSIAGGGAASDDRDIYMEMTLQEGQAFPVKVRDLSVTCGCDTRFAREASDGGLARVLSALTTCSGRRGAWCISRVGGLRYWNSYRR